jgi:hypothetical protein
MQRDEVSRAFELCDGATCRSRMRFDQIPGCGYGCIASEDVAPGDVVITVPLALVISSDAAMESRCALPRR